MPSDDYGMKPIPIVCDEKLFEMHLKTKLMELETKIWMDLTFGVAVLVTLVIWVLVLLRL